MECDSSTQLLVKLPTLSNGAGNSPSQNKALLNWVFVFFSMIFINILHSSFACDVTDGCKTSPTSREELLRWPSVKVFYHFKHHVANIPISSRVIKKYPNGSFEVELTLGAKQPDKFGRSILTSAHL